MTGKYSSDWINGQEVPPLVIRDNYVLTGIHAGTVHVESGEFMLEGVLQGTLDIQRGVNALIIGTQQGSVNLEPGSMVTVSGAIEGSTNVAAGAILLIEPMGKLAGTLTNYGQVILRGVFGGAKSGSGELKIEGQGYIKQPIIRNGAHYYEW